MSRRTVTLMDVLLFELEQWERAHAKTRDQNGAGEMTSDEAKTAKTAKTAKKRPISTTQVELTVLTRDDEPAQARIRCQYGAGLEEVVLWLSAVEMDALVASWQRERARVIVSE